MQRPAMPVAWKEVLAQVLALIDRPLREEAVEWALVGSAATAVQGCDLTPGDLDLLFRQPHGVDSLAQRMTVFAPDRLETGRGTETWASTKGAPIADEDAPDGFHWYWGRWYVDGFKVEAAHLRAPDGAQGAEPGVWENGPRMWPFSRRAPFGRWMVRVPPLEIQLATSVRRGLTDRAEAIARELEKRGADLPLLKLCLDSEDARALLRRFSEAPRSLGPS